MTNLLLILILLLLFYALGKSADLVVLNVRKINEKLSIHIVVMGLLLGIMTSFPEFGVSINASVNNLPNLSLGNLLGGLMVLLCLILGLSLVINRKIHTEGAVLKILPIMGLLLLPVLLGLKGNMGYWDGLVIIIGYLAVFFFLYQTNHHLVNLKFAVVRKSRVVKEMLLIIVGAVLVLIISNLIVKISTELLTIFQVTPFFIGLVIFSVGTNLPELTITIKSWKRHMADLSLQHLLGSTMANVLIVGFLSLNRPFRVNVNDTYLGMTALLFVVLVFFAVIYHTGKKLTRREGYILLLLYGLFILSQIVLQEV